MYIGKVGTRSGSDRVKVNFVGHVEGRRLSSGFGYLKNRRTPHSSTR